MIKGEDTQAAKNMKRYKRKVHMGTFVGLLICIAISTVGVFLVTTSSWLAIIVGYIILALYLPSIWNVILINIMLFGGCEHPIRKLSKFLILDGKKQWKKIDSDLTSKGAATFLLMVKEMGESEKSTEILMTEEEAKG